MFGLELAALIQSVGYVGIAVIVFLESGAFFGFFLPGDSLLFTAGLLSSQGYFNVWILAAIITCSAILGDSAGYWFGRKVGPFIFTKNDSFFFSKKRIEDARAFFERHGTKAVVLARFIPAIRTFIPIVAGVGTMEYGKFLFYNILGALLWGVGITFAGYFLGNTVPNIDRYLIPIVILIVFVSLIPLVFEYFKKRN